VNDSPPEYGWFLHLASRGIASHHLDLAGDDSTIPQTWKMVIRQKSKLICDFSGFLKYVHLHTFSKLGESITI